MSKTTSGSAEPPASPRDEVFRTIAEYTYDWEAWVDSAGTTRWINPAVERITGFSASECMARSDYPLGLTHPEDRAVLARVLEDASRGGSGNDVEFRVITRSGEPRWVAISWQAMRDPSGGGSGYRTSVRDIDERKRLEAELHAMRRRAEAAANARSQLLANVSHELRSPTHAIAGFAELLLESSLTATQARYVGRIRDECRSMTRHVEDLLQLAALEAGGVRLLREPFDLGAMLRALMLSTDPFARARGLALVLDIDPSIDRGARVEGDALRIEQVIRNLLDNAIKFAGSEPGAAGALARGEVRLAARPIEHPEISSAIELAVIDRGIGIAPEHIERLLQPFEQVDRGTTRRHGGVGLGLSICVRLVRAMGGTLVIESELGAGTAVRAVLPLPRSRASEAAAETQRASRPSVQGAEVLVVEDSAAARELMREMLAVLGARAHEAASRSEALAIAARERIDLVLLDYQMPDSDGAEVAMALRKLLSARDPTRRVPMHIVTANVFARDQLEGASEAIDGITAKPLSLAALETLVMSAIGSEKQEPVTSGGAAATRRLDPRVVEDLRSATDRDGQTLLARILPRARGEIARELAALEEARRAGQARRVAEAAHRIAGNAAMVGAVRAADRARAIERSASEGGVDAGAIEELAREWSLADEELQRLAS